MSQARDQDGPSSADPRGAAAWDAATLRDPHGQADKARRVRAMFDAIAPTYERVNTVATFGRDAAWRRKAVRSAGVRPTDIVLDIACGTGDMIRTFAAGRPPPARIIGLDFSANMLARGSYAGVTAPVHLIQGDAEALPLVDESVDVISCAFGVRNFQSLDAGLREMGRVLRPGGRAVILEFANPDNAFIRAAHDWYTNVVLPALGALIGRDKSGAYRYLPKSIHTFDTPRIMLRRMDDAGLGPARVTRMNFGGVALYCGGRTS
ncbi:MAG: ubiquinone/menaquinone biosynthesis methyltransferase [Phycisphaerae bacterium]